MNIIAKFRVWGVTPSGSDERVELGAVTDNSPENKTFSTATPCAHLTMYISNPSAKGQFEIGKEYLLAFKPAT